MTLNFFLEITRNISEIVKICT